MRANVCVCVCDACERMRIIKCERGETVVKKITGFIAHTHTNKCRQTETKTTS